MPNLNKVMLIGHLTRDVETRAVGGNTVANFGMAVNHKWKGKDGEKKEETCFVDLEAWNRSAEVLAQYVKKGDPLYVEGRLKLDTWEKDGQKFSKLRVVVDGFQFLGGKPDTKPTSQPPSASRKMPTYAETKAAFDQDDDIPFDQAR